jgi:hypothetical protein
VRTPLFASASSPTKLSLFSIPTITFVNLGRPTIEGKADLGASYPLIPALHIPEPLSTMTGYDPLSFIFAKLVY